MGELAGFSDYTMFYRAYRKILNRAPSADSRDSKSGNSQLLSMRMEDGAASDPGNGKMANRNGTIREPHKGIIQDGVSRTKIKDAEQILNRMNEAG